MALWMGSAVSLAAVNLALLLVLVTVWVRNYRTFRSQMLLGLILFASVLALENVIALGAFLSTEMVYAGGKQAMYALVAFRGLQFLALAFLTVVTLFPSGRILRSPIDRSGEQDPG
jgi:hypothetical protein